MHTALCRYMLQKVYQEDVVILSDEAHFHVSGTVNNHIKELV